MLKTVGYKMAKPITPKQHRYLGIAGLTLGCLAILASIVISTIYILRQYTPPITLGVAVIVGVGMLVEGISEIRKSK